MLNKAMLIGNIGYIDTKDISGKKVSQFSLATNRTYKDKNGDRQTTTEWHAIVLWEHDKLIPYLIPGTKVYVEGEIRYRTYTNKEGVNKSITEILVTDIKLLSTAKSDDKQEQKQEQKNQEKGKVDAGGTPDDDLPF
jgi:single-strand DNA-binding protein